MSSQEQTLITKHAEDPDTTDVDVTVDEGIDLAEDPFSDDLSAQLTAKAPRKLMNRATVVLGALVLVIGGFIGGSQAQKSWGTPAASTGTGFPGAGDFTGFNRGQGGPGGAGTGQGGGAGATAATTTTGTVKLVDGTTVYLETAAGAVITVKTSAATAIQLAQKLALKDLKTGAKITIEGPAAGADGVITATKVTAQK